MCSLGTCVTLRSREVRDTRRGRHCGRVRWQTAHVRTALLLVAGLVLVASGLAVARDWRGVAQKYTDFISNVVPTPPRGDPRKQERRLLSQNRVIGAVVTVFGVALILAGLASLTT